MIKEFAPYELAVRLKALDYDEPCFVYYRASNENKPAYPNHGVTQNSLCSNGITAPTFSQAFRWFREKYGLQHDITLCVGDNNQLVGFYMLIHKFDPLWNEDQIIELEVNATDREEAELACLTKLIEIVEDKSE